MEMEFILSYKGYCIYNSHNSYYLIQIDWDFIQEPFISVEQAKKRINELTQPTIVNWKRDGF